MALWASGSEPKSNGSGMRSIATYNYTFAKFQPYLVIIIHVQYTIYLDVDHGFRNTILSRLVTIIKRMVHHAVYCIYIFPLSLVLFIQSLYPLSENFHLLNYYYYKNYLIL